MHFFTESLCAILGWLIQISPDHLIHVLPLWFTPLHVYSAISLSAASVGGGGGSPDVSVSTPPPTPPTGDNGNNNNNNSDLMHETILEENENDGWEKVQRMGSRKKSGSLCSISSSTSSRSGERRRKKTPCYVLCVILCLIPFVLWKLWQQMIR